MQISIHIPDDVALTLGGEQPDLSRAALEALAIEGYRRDQLSEHQICRMLDLNSRLDVHAFLKAHSVPLNYALADLEQDAKSLTHLQDKLTV